MNPLRLSLHELPRSERALDLMVEQACWGLDGPSEAELAGLLREERCDAPASSLEPAASAFSIALIADGRAEAMPESLRRSLSAAGAAFCAPAPLPVAEEPPPALRLSGDLDEIRREGRVPALAWFGWLAAAAAIVAAVLITTPGATLSPAQRLATLLAGNSPLVTANWTGLAGLQLAAADHPLDHGVTGRVVIDPATDEGYMEIAGLEPNDPAAFQYQLWIFDADRPTGELPHFKALGLDILTQRPVDGGVFDFTPGADGKAVIPIDAKLNVGKPVIFAITKEPPGGVVVSDRDIVFAAVAG